MEENRSIFNFELNNSITASLIPLEAFEYYFFIKESDSISIKEDVSPDLDVYDDLEKNGLGLAELYIAAKILFGESTTLYDKYKGSYAYHFLLIIKRADFRFTYVMNFKDYSTVPSFQFSRVVINNDIKYKKSDLETYVEPFKEELSRKNIGLLVHKFMMFLVGVYKGYFHGNNDYIKEKFVRYNEKGLLIYGNIVGEPFNIYYDDYDKFWDDFAKFEKFLKKEKISLNQVRENKSIDTYHEKLIKIKTGNQEYILFGIQNDKVVLKYEYKPNTAEEYLGIALRMFDSMEDMKVKFVAGTKKDIISKRRLKENWIISDIGFSNKSKSCGLVISDRIGKLENFDKCENDICGEFTFSEAKSKIIDSLKNSEGKTVNLIIEAPLSVAFDKKGNPKGRKIEKSGFKTRYWYYGAASTVNLATMYLIKEISELRVDITIRLFEGFISFKKKDNKSSHLDDVKKLIDIIKKSKKDENVINAKKNKADKNDLIKNSLEVVGIKMKGIPVIITDKINPDE